jgi:hypothetical protein
MTKDFWIILGTIIVSIILFVLYKELSSNVNGTSCFVEDIYPPSSSGIHCFPTNPKGGLLITISYGVLQIITLICAFFLHQKKRILK